MKKVQAVPPRHGRFLGITAPLLFLILNAGFLVGQADQGAITGVVTDNAGAVVTDADVTLTNTDTNLVLRTQSDKNGIYNFSPIKIGNYKISVGARGFATTTQSNVHVDVQQRLAVNFRLRPGMVSQTVEVTGAPPLLQTEDASVGQVISAKTIDETPLNGRNWVYIAQTAAGIDPPEGSRGAGKGDFNANGQRAEQNNFILDGVDNNTNVVDFSNGASFVVRPPPDALAEFKIQTSDYSAEFGHSAGAVVNASIKSGTNEIHGNLWEYVRNTALDARDWENTSVPTYHQNQFGATLGLAILKNKLFFFGDVEENRIVFQEPATLTVPTAKMQAGDFSELLNGPFMGGSPIVLSDPGTNDGKMGSICGNPQNVMCASSTDPEALKLLNLFPAGPPASAGGTFANNYSVLRKSNDDTFQFDTRLDWNVSTKDQAFVRYSLVNEPAYHPAPLPNGLDGGWNLAFGDVGAIVNLGRNFALSETHVFSNSLTNEFRFGYNWGHFAYRQDYVDNPNFASSLGLGGIPGGANNGGTPLFNVGGISSFGSSGYYVTSEFQNVFQILDNVSKTLGRHALKFGVSLQHIRFATLQPPFGRGEYDYASGGWADCDSPTGGDYNSYTGFGVADFLAGTMGCAAITAFAGTDDERWDRSVYAQDDWKATSRLTLNLGVRYEYPQTYKELFGHQAQWYPTGPLVAGNTPSTYLIPTQSQNISLGSIFPVIAAKDHVTVQYSNNPFLVNQDKTNFAPRIGLAYRLTDRATVRAGYGMFFGGMENVGYSPNLGLSVPFVFISQYNTPATQGISLATGFTNQLQAGLVNAITLPGLRGITPNLTTPYSENYSLAVEYGITNNMVATLSYVGSQAHHLVVWINPNSPLALNGPNYNGPTLLPLPDFGAADFTAYEGISNYNSLQAKLERRFANGISFLATYTWSHSLDDAQAPLGSNGDGGYPNINVEPIRQQYSNSPFDTRQRFTFNGNYRLPFGHGQKYLNRNGILDYVVGGWSSTLSFAAQTGNPFSVDASGSSVTPFSGASGASVYYATLIGDPFKAGGTPPASNPGITCPTSVRNRNNWYNPCAFGNPSAGSLIIGNQTVAGAAAMPYLGGVRDEVSGPGYERINLSLFKDFRIREKTTLQFRADIFNLFNTPSYANPSSNYNNGGASSGVNNNSSQGGQITLPRSFQNYTPDARFIQLALKLSF
ncbi:MAG TPA: TonB-dependent receptor [Terriglobales bacterium]|nr:TonB-dependent receptor [Terriglobales bacterium]